MVVLCCDVVWCGVVECVWCVEWCGALRTCCMEQVWITYGDGALGCFGVPYTQAAVLATAYRHNRLAVGGEAAGRDRAMVA